jgi:hypothetical protein
MSNLTTEELQKRKVLQNLRDLRCYCNVVNVNSDLLAMMKKDTHFDHSSGINDAIKGIEFGLKNVKALVHQSCVLSVINHYKKGIVTNVQTKSMTNLDLGISCQVYSTFDDLW